GYVLRGGYFTFKTDYLEPFCIPSIGAASKKLNSERLVERANNLFATGNAVDSGDGPSYQEILRALAAERITQEKEQSVLNTNLTD
ncbi:hypothetical protein, partial [Halorubrum sp. SP9]